MVSSGLDDLDILFGSGGIPLGTLTIFSEDGWSRHDDLFLKYFVSEGLAVQQSIGVVVPYPRAESASVGDFMLKNMSNKEMNAREKDEAVQDESKLRIAWQYEKYRNPREMHAQSIAAQGPRPTLGASRVQTHIRTKSRWAHDFDISKPPNAGYRDDELKRAQEKCDVRVLAVNPSDGLVSQTVEQVKGFIDSISRKEFSDTSGSIGRVIIPNLGSLLWDGDDDDDDENRGQDRLVNLLTHLRSLIQQRPNISIMTTIPLQQLEPSQAARIRHVADALFQLDAVEDTSQVVNLSKDSKTVAGHLEILKLPAFGAVKAPLPQIRSYVIRNKRRRLVIEAVEVDPDAEQAFLERAAQEMNPSSLISKPPSPHTIDF